MNKNKVDAIDVRSIVNIDRLRILNGTKRDRYILFEDGVVVKMKSNEIILNRYIWELFTIVPELKITSRHNIANYFNNNIFTSKSINKVFEAILEDALESLLIPKNMTHIRNELYRKMFIIMNLIYNEVVYSNLDYATTLNILNLLDIQLEPELISAMKEVAKVETRESIEKTYEILDKLMFDKDRLAVSSLARSYVSGQINPNQAKQVLASRGYVSEVDGSIFKKPIATSYTLGLQNMYDVATESRPASKALFLADKAIQDSEYFARELQLVCMEVEKVVESDCGNNETLEWYVRGDYGKSDLNNLLGKWYSTKDGKESGYITSNHKHLIGKTILLRSVLHCKHKNKHEVCSACFGKLFYSINRYTNIGHACAATLTQKFTQSILSTKHLTTSASGGKITLDDTAKAFFVIKDNDGYAFKQGFINKNISVNLIVAQNNAFGIKDIVNGSDMYKFDPSRISRISSFILAITKNDETDYYPIVVKDGNKLGSFTYKFLEYVSKVGYTLDSKDRYVINLDGWKSNVPILKLPQIEFSYSVLANEVKSMLKSMKVIKNEYSVETKESILQKLFDTINSKLDVNIALLEIITYAFTVSSIRNRDYTLGRFSDDEQMAGIMACVSNRSLGSGYAYQRVPKQITDPRSFSEQNRSDHVLDTLIRPNETLVDYYGSLTSINKIK